MWWSESDYIKQFTLEIIKLFHQELWHFDNSDSAAPCLYATLYKTVQQDQSLSWFDIPPINKIMRSINWNIWCSLYSHPLTFLLKCGIFIEKMEQVFLYILDVKKCNYIVFYWRKKVFNLSATPENFFKGNLPLFNKREIKSKQFLAVLLRYFPLSKSLWYLLLAAAAVCCRGPAYQMQLAIKTQFLIFFYINIFEYIPKFTNGKRQDKDLSHYKVKRYGPAKGPAKAL